MVKELIPFIIVSLVGSISGNVWVGSGILRGHTVLITGGLEEALIRDEPKWRTC